MVWSAFYGNTAEKPTTRLVGGGACCSAAWGRARGQLLGRSWPGRRRDAPGGGAPSSYIAVSMRRALASHGAGAVDGCCSRLWGRRVAESSLCRSALGILSVPSGPVDVVAKRRGRRLGGAIRVRHSRRLHLHDCCIHNGIPTTTVARTLFDLAGDLNPRRLRNAWEQAERLRLDSRAPSPLRRRHWLPRHGPPPRAHRRPDRASGHQTRLGGGVPRLL